MMRRYPESHQIFEMASSYFYIPSLPYAEMCEETSLASLPRLRIIGIAINATATSEIQPNNIPPPNNARAIPGNI